MYIPHSYRKAFDKAMEDALRLERIANNPFTLKKGKRDHFMDLAWEQFRLAVFIESN